MVVCDVGKEVVKLKNTNRREREVQVKPLVGLKQLGCHLTLVGRSWSPKHKQQGSWKQWGAREGRG